MSAAIAPNFDGSQPCAQTDAEAFFASTDETISKYERSLAVAIAKRICRHCPFQLDCLDYALAHDDEGIWGGKTERERRRTLRGRTARRAA